jgi:hypothetical protein
MSEDPMQIYNNYILNNYMKGIKVTREHKHGISLVKLRYKDIPKHGRLLQNRSVAPLSLTLF